MVRRRNRSGGGFEYVCSAEELDRAKALREAGGTLAEIRDALGFGCVSYWSGVLAVEGNKPRWVTSGELARWSQMRRNGHTYKAIAYLCGRSTSTVHRRLVEVGL